MKIVVAMNPHSAKVITSKATTPPKKNKNDSKVERTDMNRNLIVAALSEMSRPELNATAKRIGVKTGKSKANTIANVADAIAGVKGARCTIELTIRKGESAAVSGEVIFASKFRSARAATPLRSAILTPAGV